jgi:hypothetical protein
MTLDLDAEEIYLVRRSLQHAAATTSNKSVLDRLVVLRERIEASMPETYAEVSFRSLTREGRPL